MLCSQVLLPNSGLKTEGNFFPSLMKFSSSQKYETQVQWQPKMRGKECFSLLLLLVQDNNSQAVIARLNVLERRTGKIICLNLMVLTCFLFCYPRRGIRGFASLANA